jgi:hypothetical protein
MFKIASVTFLVVLVQTVALSAVTDMYSTAELVSCAPRYEKRLGEMFSSGLWNTMNGPEKQALDSVRIELPLRGQGPLDAFSYWRGDIPIVVLPVLSLKFIEDISVAYAWRHLNRHSLEPIDEYVAMLKYRRPEDFPHGRVPAPLTALGVPPEVLTQDKRVDDLSLRFRNTAWAFILAHELGHLRLRHPGNKQVVPDVSQQHEAAADAFAVDLMSRSDTIPMGIILWFQASIGYFKNRADFRTEAAYREWMRTDSTHPVNSARLQSLAVALNRAADASLSPNHTQILRFIAGQVIGMGDILAEPDMQRLVARCAVLGNPEDLRRLQDRPCDGRLK